MPYTIEYAASAARALRKLERGAAQTVFTAIDQLSQDPRPHGAIKLKGGAGEMRVRVGDYRVVYEIFDGRLVVLVLKVAHRREVYRA